MARRRRIGSSDTAPGIHALWSRTEAHRRRRRKLSPAAKRLRRRLGLNPRDPKDVWCPRCSMWHPKWVHGKSKAAKILFGNPRRYRSGDPWEHTTGYMFHGTRKLKSGRYVAAKPRRRRRKTNPQVTTIMRAAMKKAWRQIKARRRG